MELMLKPATQLKESPNSYDVTVVDTPCHHAVTAALYTELPEDHGLTLREQYTETLVLGNRTLPVITL